MRIANNSTEFIEKVTEATRQTLNKTEIGQDLTEKLLNMSLERNPEMTEEEWNGIKSQFLTFIFCQIVKEKQELMQELGGHIYRELQ